MDNAPYHSVKIDKPPTAANNKNFIKEWLIWKGANPQDHLLKNELLQMAKCYSPANDQNYAIDRIAMENGHKVLRLPPYYCQYNPIELIWAQVKKLVADQNTFKMTDLKELAKGAIAKVTPEGWAKACKHAEEIQMEGAAKEVFIDKFIESLVIDISSDDESDC